QGPAPHHDAREDHRAGPDRGALPHDHAERLPIRWPLQLACHIGSTWKDVIGEDNGRPDEDLVLQPGRLIDESVVLQLHLVPDDHARPDVGTAADDAVRAEPGVLPDLSKVPDRGARPEHRALIHISGRMDRWAVHAAPPFPSNRPGAPMGSWSRHGSGYG